MPKYHQGKYKVRNLKKYKGDATEVVWRSSWELLILKWLDMNPACIEFSSEEIVIPYYSPVDEKMHRYFVDFLATFQYPTGEVKKFLIEVKPKAQTMIPAKGTKRDKRYLLECQTYAVNDAKWKAALQYCQERNWIFKIITEDDLGISNKTKKANR